MYIQFPANNCMVEEYRVIYIDRTILYPLALSQTMNKV